MSGGSQAGEKARLHCRGRGRRDGGGGKGARLLFAKWVGASSAPTLLCTHRTAKLARGAPASHGSRHPVVQPCIWCAPLSPVSGPIIGQREPPSCVRAPSCVVVYVHVNLSDM